MADYNTKKDIQNYLNQKLVSHLVWDESEQCMVEVYRTGIFKSKSVPSCIFYHPWERRKYTEDQVETKPLPSLQKKCTCGGKFVGNCHSDWCDINYKEEYELPF